MLTTLIDGTPPPSGRLGLSGLLRVTANCPDPCSSDLTTTSRRSKNAGPHCFGSSPSQNSGEAAAVGQHARPLPTQRDRLVAHMHGPSCARPPTCVRHDQEALARELRCLQAAPLRSHLGSVARPVWRRCLCGASCAANFGRRTQPEKCG